MKGWIYDDFQGLVKTPLIFVWMLHIASLWAGIRNMSLLLKSETQDYWKHIKVGKFLPLTLSFIFIFCCYELYARCKRKGQYSQSLCPCLFAIMMVSFYNLVKFVFVYVNDSICCLEDEYWSPVIFRYWIW